jgi:hypothetical protein
MTNYNMEKVFSNIYKTCAWGSNGHSKYNGSSGDGSSPEYNIEYIEFVKKFIKDNNIKSVSDGGCGDWRLGSSLYYDMEIEYNGYDVYSDLINHLQTEYDKPKFNFTHLDIFKNKDQIKDADLFVIKDVMQHWDDSATKEFVDWIIKTNKFKFVLITNCSPGRNGMTQEGSNGGWRGLSCEHPIFKNRGFVPMLRYHTKEVMLYTSNTSPMKKIYEIINNFKIDKKFWSYNNLSGEDYQNRSKPAPYIKKTVQIAKLLGLTNFVEIGSTRFAATNKCIEYYNKENEPFNSPPCCTDGHSTFFFTKEGFNVYSVDIDENCKIQNEWSYNNINQRFPDNLHLIIPKDGIEFLNEFDGMIDILYLDGWDVGTPNYAEKHLEAFLAAKNKLSDVHLILIDDTDFNTLEGGKDKTLSPFLIDLGYIPLFNGRQTLFINTLDFELPEQEIPKISEFVDYDQLVVLSMTTTSKRISETREGWGVKPVIENLLNLSYKNYEIHLNIPYVDHKTNVEYIIPDWILELSEKDNRLKIFRCNDYGSITKIVPTLMRVTDPNCVIITLDDDLIYMDGFIEYHLNKRNVYPNSALGFAGISSRDGSCHLCTTVDNDTEVRVIEGYKTVSYSRGYFEDDFFNDFVGKSWSDDIVISAYMGKRKIPRIVLRYDNDEDFRARVESFPIIRVVPNDVSGCNLYRQNQITDNYEYFDKLGYYN